MLEVQLHPVPLSEARQELQSRLRPATEHLGGECSQAELHGRGVKVHAKSIRREMIQVMRLKARDVRRDFESGLRKFLVEAVIPRAASPPEDPRRAFAN